jgi:hypothetical protein
VGTSLINQVYVSFEFFAVVTALLLLLLLLPVSLRVCAA